MPDQTQPMPPAQPPQGPQSQPTPGPAPQGPPPGPPLGPPHGPPQGPPQGPSAPHPAGPPAGYEPYQGPQPERRPGLWHQATATTGGRVATAVALVLSGLLLLGILAGGVFAIARVGDRFVERRENVGRLQDGQQGMRGPMGRPDGDDAPGRGNGNGLGRGNGNGNGNGMMGDGVLPRLGAVSHGEFTITGADGKPVVMTLQRGAVTSASATSVAVRSDDNFAKTYVVNDQTRVLPGGSAAALAKGSQVVVLARKDGGVAVQIRSYRVG
ncbi:MAG TPA: hypothetical protein VFX53_16135 [Pedococcus sp.]|nr:hypothetical protein [Pedococcus sp.]